MTIERWLCLALALALATFNALADGAELTNLKQECEQAISRSYPEKSPRRRGALERLGRILADAELGEAKKMMAIRRLLDLVAAAQTPQQDIDGDTLAGKSDPWPMIANFPALSWRLHAMTLAVQAEASALAGPGEFTWVAPLYEVSRREKRSLSNHPLRIHSLVSNSVGRSKGAVFQVYNTIPWSSAQRERAATCAEFVRRLERQRTGYSCRLDLTVVFYTFAAADLIAEKLEIPLKLGNEILVFARPGAAASAESLRLTGSQPRGVPIQFHANLDAEQTARLVAAIQEEPPVVDVGGYRGRIRVAGNDADVIRPAVERIEQSTVAINVELGEYNFVWRLAPAVGDRPVLLREALTAINRALDPSQARKVFVFRDRFLRSVGGTDNSDTHWWHVVAANGRTINVGDYLNMPLQADLRFVLKEYWPTLSGLNYRRLAERGDSWAQFVLARCFFGGWGVKKDMALAAEWYRRAAAKGHIWAQLSLGRFLCDGIGLAEDDAEAATWFRKAAAQGNPRVQFVVGMVFKEGTGLPADPREAREWFLQAAQQGNTAAQYRLGDLYASDKGKMKNPAEAERWFRLAAQRGHAGAQLGLAQMLSRGAAPKSQKAEALNWYLKAAEQGEVGAQFSLGVIYETGDAVPPSATRAIDWYLRAAAKDHPGAPPALGRLYALDRDNPNSLAQAVKWHAKAADGGSAVAAYRTACLRARMPADSPEAGEAAKWFERAAEAGIVPAQFAMGQMAELGLGVERNFDIAFQWYSKAAAAGHSGAQYQVARFYEAGRAVEEDKSKALEWDLHAASQDESGQQRRLVREYGEVVGLPRTGGEAELWLAGATEHGHAGSQYQLGKIFGRKGNSAANEQRAVTWLLRAAKQGHSGAYRELTKMLGERRGVTAEAEKAMSWLWSVQREQSGATPAARPKGAAAPTPPGDVPPKKAAAPTELGRLLADLVAAEAVPAAAPASASPAEQSFRQALALHGKPGNEVEAYTLYLGAALDGHAGAQTNLGLLYARGVGVERNLTSALKWSRKAAEQDLVAAQFNLGCLYSKGAAKDADLALYWFKKAAESGHAQARNNMGFIYANGVGVASDLVAAYAWLRLAAGQELADAEVGVSQVAGKMSDLQLANGAKLLAQLTRKMAPPQE